LLVLAGLQVVAGFLGGQLPGAQRGTYLPARTLGSVELDFERVTALVSFVVIDSTALDARAVRL
jgi:hypothetical protein